MLKNKALLALWQSMLSERGEQIRIGMRLGRRLFAGEAGAQMPFHSLKFRIGSALHVYYFSDCLSGAGSLPTIRNAPDWESCVESVFNFATSGVSMSRISVSMAS